MGKTKFAIGCLVQWHECDIIGEYIETLKEAIEEYDGEVIVDIILALNQDLAKTSNDVFFKTLPGKFQEVIWDLEKTVKVNYTWTVNLYTIADYRREFNDKYCEQADVLVWGEPDMLVPKQSFIILDSLHQQVKETTPKYLSTFALSKMWDNSWKPLEHIEFTNKPFDGENDKNWWGLRYTMSKEEMNSFNDKVEELEITNISPHKFQGCGLIISSEVIKSGVNIPKSVFFVHEDTAFMHMTNKILGDIPQYHFKNILMVHNRKHPKKMLNVVGKENYGKYDIGKLRNKNQGYRKAFEMSLQNSNNIFNPNYKSYTWKDVWK